MVVIDTDVLIAFSKGQQKIVEAIEELEKKEEISTTIFNAEEYLFGLFSLENKNLEDKGKELLMKINIYDYSMNEVSSVVKVKLSQKKKGKIIGKYDEAIAGICISKNERLFTLNKKHFEQVEGLKLI